MLAPETSVRRSNATTPQKPQSNTPLKFESSDAGPNSKPNTPSSKLSAPSPYQQQHQSPGAAPPDPFEFRETPSSSQFGQPSRASGGRQDSGHLSKSKPVDAHHASGAEGAVLTASEHWAALREEQLRHLLPPDVRSQEHPLVLKFGRLLLVGHPTSLHTDTDTPSRSDTIASPESDLSCAFRDYYAPSSYALASAATPAASTSPRPEEAQDSVSSLNIAFILPNSTPAPLLARYLMFSRQMGAALAYLESRQHYVQRQFQQFSKLNPENDAMADADEANANDSEGSQQKVRHTDITESPDQPRSQSQCKFFEKILKNLQLAREIRYVFDELVLNGFVFLRLNGCVELALQLPEKTCRLALAHSAAANQLSVEMMLRRLRAAMRPYHSVLLFEDQLKKLLPFECKLGEPYMSFATAESALNPQMSQSTRFLSLPSLPSPSFACFRKLVSPGITLERLAAEADLTLRHVFELVTHLVSWGAAALIYPVCESNFYVPHPRADVALSSRNALDFLSQFKSAHGSSAAASSSSPLKGHLWPVLVEFSRPAPLWEHSECASWDDANDRAPMFLWLLGQQLLQQVHTFVALRPSARTLLAAFFGHLVAEYLHSQSQADEQLHVPEPGNEEQPARQLLKKDPLLFVSYLLLLCPHAPVLFPLFHNFLRCICCDACFKAFSKRTLAHESSPSPSSSVANGVHSIEVAKLVAAAVAPDPMKQLAASIRLSMLAGQADNAARECRFGCEQCSRGAEPVVTGSTVASAPLSPPPVATSLSNTSAGPVGGGSEKTGDAGESASQHVESSSSNSIWSTGGAIDEHDAVLFLQLLPLITSARLVGDVEQTPAGEPVALELAGGQRADAQHLEALMFDLNVSRVRLQTLLHKCSTVFFQIALPDAATAPNPAT